MKLIYLIIITLFFSIGLRSYNEIDMMAEDYTGCYVCYQKNTYVRYKGADTKELRKKAHEIFGCKAFISIDYCNVITDKTGYTLIDVVLK